MELRHATARALRQIALSAIGVLAVSAPAGAGVWTSFTQADGLPGDGVAAIASVPDDGTLVIAAHNNATADSVAEFDGIRFRNLLDRYATKPDLGPEVTSLAVSSDGPVWVGTRDRGVFRLGATDWTQHTRDDGLGGRASNNVRALLPLPNGGVIAVVLNGGVSTWDGQQWTTLGVDQGLPNAIVLDAAFGMGGSLWIAHSAGLSRATDSGMQNFDYPLGFERVMVTSDGHVWGIRSSHGAVEFDADGTFLARYHQGSAPPSVTSNDLTTLVEGTHGDLWFGTFSLGLSRRTVSGWESLTTADGLLGNTVHALHRDAAGVLWVGTPSGLSRYEGALWMTWNLGSGLAALEVNGLDFGHPGGEPPPPAGIRDQVYAALGTNPPGAQGGVARLSGHTVSPVIENGSPLIGRFRGVSAVTGGAWAIDDFSLVRIAGTTVTGRFDPPSSPLDPLHAVLAASDGTVWVGSDSALFRFDGTTFTRVDLPGLGAKPNIRALAEDEQARIWMAAYTAGGARLDPVSGTLTIFGPAQGIPGTQFNAVHVGPDGTAWIGSDQGAARLVADAVQFVARTSNGLPSDVVFAFTPDPTDQRIWIGTNSGVAYYENGAVTAYGPADGLPAPSVRAIVSSFDGVLVGTSNGGIGQFRYDLSPPRAEIEFAPPPVSGGRRAQFLFRGGDLESGDAFIRYAWSLDGAPLSAFTSARAVVLDQLADGAHRFSVFVRDRALNVSEGAHLDFEIDATPPQPVMVQPAFGAVVRGAATLRGRIDDPRFALLRIDVRPEGPDDPALNPWQLLFEDSSPPSRGDTLFVWDTAPFVDGDYELRVSVRDTLGLIGYAAAGVTVDNLSPGDAVTAPARISAQEGGRVFTLNAEVEAYFPPHAFDSDRIVEIDSVSVEGRPVPPIARRWLAGWRLTPDDVALAKPVTIAFSLAALGDSVTSPAIVRLLPDSTVQVIGGTVDEGRGTLSTSVDRLGTFLVAEVPRISLTVSGDVDLDVQPRAFSPRGGTFDDRAAVAFTLAQPGNARVRVYDRSGRLVRDVFDGALGAGRNVVYWDGRGGNGATVQSGVYTVALEAGGSTEVRSVAVVNR